MKVDLRVRLFKQPAHTDYCGQYCVKMILNKFGIPVTIPTVNKTVRYTRGGTLDSSIALAVQTLGALPTLYTLPDNDTYLQKYVDMKPQQIATSFERRARKTKSKINTRGWKDLAQLFKHDLVRFEAPTAALLRDQLDSGSPMIVGVSVGSFYFPKPPGFEGTDHFVVIRGYNEQQFLVNDPVAGVVRIPQDRMTYAIARCEGTAIAVQQNGLNQEMTKSTNGD